MPDLLEAILSGDDELQRQGAAQMCAQRIADTGDLAITQAALVQFFHDPQDSVREAASKTATALRGRRLRPYRETLTKLIASSAFSHALPQLLITLEHAADRVDNLVLGCVRRFIEVHGSDAADLSTHAAADAYHIGELLIRAYAQASSPAQRSEILDVLDDLLLQGAYGVAKAVVQVERL